MKTKIKTKKMSNEGHETPVRHSTKIGLVFVIGLLAGGAVTFLAVAGRTETVIQQRRALYLSKKAQETNTPAPVEAKASPAAPGDAAR